MFGLDVDMNRLARMSKDRSLEHFDLLGSYEEFPSWTYLQHPMYIKVLLLSEPLE